MIDTYLIFINPAMSSDTLNVYLVGYNTILRAITKKKMNLLSQIPDTG